MTKTEITNALNNLSGWSCKTFNSYRANATGMKGFPDHFLFHEASGSFLFIEIKLGRDKLSEKQRSYLYGLDRACKSNKKAMSVIFPNEKLKCIADLTDFVMTFPKLKH